MRFKPGIAYIRTTTGTMALRLDNGFTVIMYGHMKELGVISEYIYVSIEGYKKL